MVTPAAQPVETMQSQDSDDDSIPPLCLSESSDDESELSRGPQPSVSSCPGLAQGGGSGADSGPAADANDVYGENEDGDDDDDEDDLTDDDDDDDCDCYDEDDEDEEDDADKADEDVDDEYDDFDEQEQCWCPSCTHNRLQLAADAAMGQGEEEFILPVLETLSHVFQTRGEGRQVGLPSSQQEQRSGFQGPQASHGPTTSGTHSPQYVYAPASELLSRPPWEVGPSTGSGPMDIPSSEERAARARQVDVLGEDRPPPELEPLLRSEGYLDRVLSGLPGVNQDDDALKAVVAALQRSNPASSTPQPPHTAPSSEQP